jgi:hypothetical protein
MRWGLGRPCPYSIKPFNPFRPTPAHSTPQTPPDITTKVVLPALYCADTFAGMLGRIAPQHIEPNSEILTVVRLMKAIIWMIALCFSVLGLNAQVVSGLKPSPDGKMGEYTEWKKADVVFEDQTNAAIEYRIALASRTGLACNYKVEVKNVSDIKLDVRIKSNYYDRLVKSHFGDEGKQTLKPGKSVEAKFIGQGCKKEKGTNLEDYALCIDCDLTVSIFVSK